MRGLSMSLRAELAPHKIGVTALCPGLILEDARLVRWLERCDTGHVWLLLRNM